MATRYIYNASGEAVAFIQGNDVHALTSNAIGQVHGTHAYKHSGRCVGELDHDMIVDKIIGNLGSIGSSGNPGSAGSPGNPENRGATNYVRDVFDDLLD